MCWTSGILRYGSTPIKANCPLVWNRETDMFRLTPKKCKATKKWHSRAMLIDPRKTRLTIVNLETLY
jgi:hypothetical protein